MVSADPQKLITAYQELQSIRTRLGIDEDGVQNVRGHLTGPQYEETRQALQKAVEDMDGEILALEKMIAVTDMACSAYSACEERISENCDGAAMRFTVWQIGQIDLTGIKDVVSQVIKP